MSVPGDQRAPFFSYWGKAHKESGEFHLLPFHCLDVGAVAETMVRQNAILRHRLRGFFDVADDGVAPLTGLMAALHDFGKLDVRFQLKVREIATRLHPTAAGLSFDATGFDHGAWGYHHFLALAERMKRDLGTDSLALLQAVCGHHGAFPSNERPLATPLTGPAKVYDEEARTAWLDAILELYRSRGAPLPWLGRPSSALVQLLAGTVSVADWIGSQEDVFVFRATPEDLGTYLDQAMAWARSALQRIGNPPANLASADFEQLFGFAARDVQIVGQHLPIPTGPGLVIVEARMGAGKTELALHLAARFIAGGAADGVYVALPTMATSNGMFKRLLKIIPKMFQGEVHLRLAHGRSRTDQTFESLVRRTLEDQLDRAASEAAVVCARWFLSRKRALLSQFGVGTVDQAMQAALRVRHHFVRAFGLSTSVVVIDEVHAYDAYMEVILDRLLEWLAALGVPVVVLSATLPANRRQLLARTYLRGRGVGEAPSLVAATDAPYPLVTVVDERGTSTHAGPPGDDRVVDVVAHPTAAPVEDVVPRLVDLARNGAMVAWVRNTVGEVQSAFRRARDQGVPVQLFHSRFRGVDRQRIEADVLERFGPDGERDGRILVATQVVEQSLDLDFDYLVTDLAPVDLVLQRTGRLHRHDRVRPTGLERPVVELVRPVEADVAALRFGPSARVYDPVTLWLASESLSQLREIRIPGDLRPLVEASYKPGLRLERLRAAPNAARLLEAEKYLNEDLETRRARAARVCIPPTDVSPQAFACLGDNDENLRALTREGDSTMVILVCWDESLGAGGSIDMAEPWALDASSSNGWRLARELLEETISVPAHGTWRIAEGIEVGSKRLWAAWRKAAQKFLDDAGLSGVVLVPVAREDDTFVGCVLMDGKRRRVRYDRIMGFSFEKDDKQ